MLKINTYIILLIIIMENKLLSYQNVHVKSLGNSITKHHRALDASDTGTGKTYTTIALCRLLNLRPFIVCPKSVISTWQQVLTYFEYSKNQYDLTTYNQIINHKIIKKKFQLVIMMVNMNGILMLVNTVKVIIYSFTMKLINVKIEIQLMLKY